jgi:hypothetical protein
MSYPVKRHRTHQEVAALIPELWRQREAFLRGEAAQAAGPAAGVPSQSARTTPPDAIPRDVQDAILRLNDARQGMGAPAPRRLTPEEERRMRDANLGRP